MTRSMIYILALVSFVTAVCLWAMTKSSTQELFYDGGTVDDPILSIKNTDVYLINMKKNADRLDHFIKMYSRSDLSKKRFMRLEAVDGRQVNLENIVTPKAMNEILSIEKHGYRTMHYQLTRGAVGCYLSHLSIYNMMQDSKSEVALIFEDDAKFPPNIMQQINKALARVPFDWDIFNLSCFCIKCNKYPEYTDVQQFFWTHAYLIKKDAAKKFLDYVVRTGIDKQIDSAMGVMIQMGDLKVYCARRPIVSQSNFKSTIQLPLRTITGVNPYSLE